MTSFTVDQISSGLVLLDNLPGLLLLIANLLVDAFHVLVGAGRVEWILAKVAIDAEAPHPRATMDLLPVRAVAERVKVAPIGLVVDHAPLVLAGHVAQAVVEVRETVRPLPVAVWQRLAHLLTAPVDVRIEEPLAPM